MKQFFLIFCCLYAISAFAEPIASGIFLFDRQSEPFSNDHWGWKRQQDRERQESNLVKWQLVIEPVTENVIVELSSQRINQDFVNNIDTSDSANFKPVDLSKVDLDDYVHSRKASLLGGKNCETASFFSYAKSEVGLEFVYPSSDGYKAFILLGKTKPHSLSYYFSDYDFQTSSGYGIGGLNTYDFKVHDRSRLNNAFKVACGKRLAANSLANANMQQAINRSISETLEVYLGEEYPVHEDAGFTSIFSSFVATTADSESLIVQKWLLPSGNERVWVRQTWNGKYLGPQCFMEDVSYCDETEGIAPKARCIFAMEESDNSHTNGWNVVGIDCSPIEYKEDYTVPLAWPSRH